MVTMEVYNKPTIVSDATLCRGACRHKPYL